MRLSNFSRSDLVEVEACALVDREVVELVIPEHLALQLELKDLKPRVLNLPDGRRQIVRCVGAIKVEMFGRDSVTSALVMGDQVRLGRIPMRAMDVVVHPHSDTIQPNPASPDIPSSRA